MITGISSAINAGTTSAPMMKISFRNGELKYIATLAGSEGDLDPLAVHEVREVELYHLGNDSGETDKLLVDSDFDAEPYRRVFNDYLQKARVLRANREEGPTVIDEAMKEKLRSLGYVVY